MSQQVSEDQMEQYMSAPEKQRFRFYIAQDGFEEWFAAEHCKTFLMTHLLELQKQASQDSQKQQQTAAEVEHVAQQNHRERIGKLRSVVVTTTVDTVVGANAPSAAASSGSASRTFDLVLVASTEPVPPPPK